MVRIHSKEIRFSSLSRLPPPPPCPPAPSLSSIPGSLSLSLSAAAAAVSWRAAVALAHVQRGRASETRRDLVDFFACVSFVYMVHAAFHHSHPRQDLISLLGGKCGTVQSPRCWFCCVLEGTLMPAFLTRSTSVSSWVFFCFFPYLVLLSFRALRPQDALSVGLMI